MPRKANSEYPGIVKYVPLKHRSDSYNEAETFPSTDEDWRSFVPICIKDKSRLEEIFNRFLDIYGYEIEGQKTFALAWQDKLYLDMLQTMYKLKRMAKDATAESVLEEFMRMKEKVPKDGGSSSMMASSTHREETFKDVSGGLEEKPVRKKKSKSRRFEEEDFERQWQQEEDEMVGFENPYFEVNSMNCHKAWMESKGRGSGSKEDDDVEKQIKKQEVDNEKYRLQSNKATVYKLRVLASLRYWKGIIKSNNLKKTPVYFRNLNDSQKDKIELNIAEAKDKIKKLNIMMRNLKEKGRWESEIPE